MYFVDGCIYEPHKVTIDDFFVEGNQLYHGRSGSPFFLIQLVPEPGVDFRDIATLKEKMAARTRLNAGTTVRLRRIKSVNDLAEQIDKYRKNTEIGAASVRAGCAFPIVLSDMIKYKKERNLLERQASIANQSFINKRNEGFREDLLMLDNLIKPTEPDYSQPAFSDLRNKKRAQEKLCINCDNEIDFFFMFGNNEMEIYKKTGLCGACQRGTEKIFEDLCPEEAREYAQKLGI